MFTEEEKRVLIEQVEMLTSTALSNLKDKSYYALEALLDEYNGLLNEFEEYKKHVEENYEEKEFDPYFEYGVSERDFH